MAEMITGFNCHCPLTCKGQRSLGKFKSRNEAEQKVLHHLVHSEKHYMDQASAELEWENHEDCIWEERMENWPEADEGILEPPPGQDERSRNDRSRTRHDRSRSRDNSWNLNKGKRKGLGRGQASQEEMIRSTTNQVLARVVGDVDDQRSKVFAFAKTLGRCEAVIRTASQVARSAASAFEELYKLCFLMCFANG
jgi:hypothetical protein